MFDGFTFNNSAETKLKLQKAQHQNVWSTFQVSLPVLLSVYLQQDVGKALLSMLHVGRTKVITEDCIKDGTRSNYKFILVSWFFTFKFSSSFFKSGLSPHFLSLYNRLWISCSADTPVTSENSGRSSNATRDNQLTRSRGVSVASDKCFWIRESILLWMENEIIQ